MSTWHSSPAAFAKHKDQLTKILSGQYEFFPGNSESFARTLRGLIKGVRERQEPGFESLYNATVKKVGSMVKVELGADDKPSYRTFNDFNVYQIIGELSEVVPNSTYIFRNSFLSSDEVEMVTNMCESLNLGLNIETDKIKIEA